MNRAVYWRSPRRFLAIGLLAAGSFAIGWWIVPQHTRAYAYAYAVFDPACVGALCVGALHRRAKHSRWLVPLLLVGVMLNVALHPHDPAFSAIGLAAGGLAIAACVFRHARTAIASTVLCCSAICVTLLVGLANGHSGPGSLGALRARDAILGCSHNQPRRVCQHFG